MNFKTFILKEDIGLGDIGKSMERIFANRQYNQQSGAYLSTDYSHPSPEGYRGDQDWMTKLPQNTLSIPSVEKTGKISILLTKKNPIFIQLSNNGKKVAEVFFTYDEFKRIHGSKPEIGKTMTIVFQRNKNDNSDNLSKINYAVVKD